MLVVHDFLKIISGDSLITYLNSSSTLGGNLAIPEDMNLWHELRLGLHFQSFGAAIPLLYRLFYSARILWDSPENQQAVGVFLSYQEKCLKPTQKAKCFLTCDQCHPDLWWHCLLSDLVALPGFSTSEFALFPLIENPHAPCPFWISSSNLWIYILSLILELGLAWGPLHTQPCPCCFWMNSPIASSWVSMPLPLWPALPSRPVLVPLYVLPGKSHTLCTRVMGVFPQAPVISLWICQTSIHCTNYCPHGPTASHHPSPPPPPWSVQVRRPCVASLHPYELDLATCRKLINAYWSDLSNNDLPTFTLGKTLL